MELGEATEKEANQSLLDSNISDLGVLDQTAWDASRSLRTLRLLRSKDTLGNC